MVFASYNFLFIFLPIALVGYYLVARLGAQYAVAWLVLTSLAFYAAWNPAFVILLVCSIAFNFLIGRAMLARERQEDSWKTTHEIRRPKSEIRTDFGRGRLFGFRHSTSGFVPDFGLRNSDFSLAHHFQPPTRN